MQHHLFQLTLDGKLFTAPIDPKKTLRVLDVGTGTGIWAIDYGMSARRLCFLESLMTLVQPTSIPKQRYFRLIPEESVLTATKVLGVDVSPIQPSL